MSSNIKGTEIYKSALKGNILCLTIDEVSFFAEIAKPDDGLFDLIGSSEIKKDLGGDKIVELLVCSLVGSIKLFLNPFNLSFLQIRFFIFLTESN